MPCVFQRTFPEDRSERECLDAVTPGCEWVLAGEGVASRKWDGTACLVRDGKLYARYDAKRGKPPPVDGIPCDPAPDPVTGHWPHWVPVLFQPQFKWHREAWEASAHCSPNGTYELIGPAVNANKEGVGVHVLIRHGIHLHPEAPRTHSGLKEYLSRLNAEGLVFSHPDGRMAKIRRNDFLLPWPLTAKLEAA